MFFTVNIQDDAQRNVIASFLLLGLYFKSWKNMCAVKPSYDYCTIQLCQTAARHFKASFYLGWTNWTP